MGEEKTKEFTLSPRHPMYHHPGFVYRRAGRPFKKGEPTVVSEADFATCKSDPFVEPYKAPKKAKSDPDPTKMVKADLMVYCTEKGLEVNEEMTIKEMLAELGIGQK